MRIPLTSSGNEVGIGQLHTPFAALWPEYVRQCAMVLRGATLEKVVMGALKGGRRRSETTDYRARRGVILVATESLVPVMVR